MTELIGKSQVAYVNPADFQGNHSITNLNNSNKEVM
jgi:hypothetical protein